MTRLEHAFDDLIAQHPQGDPDAILAAARDEVAADRPDRRTRYGVVAAAAVLVIAAVIGTAIATKNEPGDHLRTGPGRTRTTSSTRPTPTTTTTRPLTAPGTGHAVASVLGVALRMGPAVNTGVGLTREPAASAYAIGTDLVVFQLTDPDVDTITPPVPTVPSGPIKLWTKNEGIVRLAIDSAADSQVLLDAGRIDGAPQALVALRSGDTQDRLVLVDLRTRKVRQVVGAIGGESNHLQARLLPDGDVVSMISGGGVTSLVRWTAGDDGPVWATSLPTRRVPAIAVRGDRAALVESSPAAGGSTRVRSIDTAGGMLGPSTSLAGTLWCTDWYDADELSCTDPYGSAGAVDVRGRWRSLQTPTGAIVTTSR